MIAQENYYIAQLAVFIVLGQPTVFNLIRHGRSAALGWFCILSFCTVRIVGAALSIHAFKTGQTSTGALIVNSIGTSPLILGIVSILHEARRARHPSARKILERVIIIQYHMLVAAAIALVIVGVLGRQGTHPTDTDKHLIDVGQAILIILYGLLVLGVIVTGFQVEREAPARREGTKLYTAVVWATPFLAVRIAYGACALIDTSSKILNPVTGSVVLKVFLALIPEILIVVGLDVAGIMTRDIKMRIAHAPDARRTSDEEFVSQK